MAGTVPGRPEAQGMVARGVQDFLSKTEPREIAGIDENVRLTPAEEARLLWAVQDIDRRLARVGPRKGGD